MPMGPDSPSDIEVGMGVGELSLDMAELSDMDLTMLRTTLFLTVLWPWANPSAWSMIEIRLWLEAELSWRRRAAEGEAPRTTSCGSPPMRSG